MKKYLIGVVIVLAALLSKPGVEKHKTKINEQFKSDNPFAGAIGGGKLAASAVEFKDYYLFSLTEYKGHMVSVGVFNQVIVRNLDLNKII